MTKLARRLASLAGKAINPTANLPQGETRNIVAAQLGTSATQLRREQFIADNADMLDPADFAEWDDGKSRQKSDTTSITAEPIRTDEQLEPLYAAEAKRRQQLSQGRGVKGSQKSDNLNSSIRTDEQLEPLYAAEAKRRMLAGKSNPSQKSDEGSDDSEEGGKSYHLRTDEQLAKLAGTSRDTIDAREAVKSGEKQPTVGFWVTPFTEEPPKSHAT